MVKRKLRPVPEADWWLIGPCPDLKDLIPGAGEWESQWMAGGRQGEHNAPVDHHILQDRKGARHLWGCVRATSAGRIFYHWKTGDIHVSPWEATGEIIRIDSGAGESYGSSPGEGGRGKCADECIQSPYFIKVDDTYYMFYGAGGANLTDAERKKDAGHPQADIRGAQMCLMTSQDGIEWTRYRNEDGNSRLFTGPGPTRDPCLIRIDGLWHLYYAGTKHNDPDQPVFWCRMSKDLYQWSDPVLVHDDLNFGEGRWNTECPFVIYKEGYYYLFRTENYYQAKTHVFRSEDPLDFGIGDASDKYVGPFEAAAVELYTIDGQEYLSSNHDPRLGTMMGRLRWEEEASGQEAGTGAERPAGANLDSAR